MATSSQIQRILIPIDFSDGARDAFTTGMKFAVEYSAETFILHVSEPIRAFDWGKEKYIETAEQIERVQEGVQRRINAMWDNGGLEAVDRRKVHMVVRGGRAYQEIIEAAKARDIDLIVMGVSHEGGATAERVVREAPCSVYCVRSES